MGIPQPINDFIKVQIALWPSWRFRLLIKIDQACFFDLITSLFFVASAFLHAVLFSDDRGFIHHSFSAFWPTLQLSGSLYSTRGGV